MPTHSCCTCDLYFNVMKHSTIIIALSVILLIYTAVNYYLFKRTGQALSGLGTARTIVLWVLFVLILAYPLGRIAERMFHNSITDFFVLSGSLYLGIGFYAFLITVLVDLARLGNRLFHFFPSVIINNPAAASRITWSVVTACVLLIGFVGYLNAILPRLKMYDLTIPKKAGDLKELTIVAVSDIHLGTVLGPAHLERIATVIHAAKPDIVLLVGDVFDEDVFETVERKTAAILQDIKARFGVYAVTGNHEYYCGLEKAVSFLQRGNVTVLQDSAVRIAGAFYLIGRKDLTSERMGSGRKTLEEPAADDGKEPSPDSHGPSALSS